MLTPELEAFLKQEGYIHVREVPGRGVCGVFRFIFTYGLVHGIDYLGYRGRWCYHNAAEAIIALATWDGNGDPPLNWIKYKGEGGERSNPENNEDKSSQH